MVKISILLCGLAAAWERGDGYVMGAKGQNPRTGYMDLSETAVKSAWKETGWYYTQYSDGSYSREQREKALYWREHATRVWDCNGLAEGIYELHTGINIDSKARFNYSQWCDPRGDNMADMPRVPGIAVFMYSSSKGYITHVGYLYEPVETGKPDGDWWVIEARGVLYGVVRTRLSARSWNRWGAMTKYFDYEGTIEKAKDDTDKNPFGVRLLKKGCTGSDVRALQETLISLGYSCGRYGADGEFGSATEAAVRAYQEARGLEADGLVGAKTKAALMTDSKEPDEPPGKEYALLIKGDLESLEAIQAIYGGEISEVAG